jgi:iron(III) transport system substrate-binding protein
MNRFRASMQMHPQGRVRARNRLVAALAVAGLLTAACGSDADAGSSADAPDASAGGSWEEVVAAAEEEGSVVFYSTRSDDVNTQLADAFMAEYPDIDVSFVRFSSGEQSERVDAELAAGEAGADVVYTSAFQWLYAGIGEEKFAELTGPSTEEWTDDERAAEFVPQGLVPISNDPYVIAYNTEQVTSEPTDFDSLLDDDYAGRIGTIEPVATVVYQIFQCYIDVNPDGVDFWQEGADLGYRFYPSTGPMTQAVASGEIAWTTVSFPYLVEGLKDQGAPIEWYLPESGSCYNDTYAAALAEAQHPNAAQVLMNFMMSVDGQEILNLNGVSVMDADVPGTLDIDRSNVVFFDYLNWDQAATESQFHDVMGR